LDAIIRTLPEALSFTVLKVCVGARAARPVPATVRPRERDVIER
jgi:hypothetical protein